MFMSVIENIEGIKRVAVRDEYQKELKVLTASEIAILKEVIVLLEPFREITSMISGKMSTYYWEIIFEYLLF